MPARPLAASLSVPSPPRHHDDLGARRRPRPGRGGWRGRAGWSRPASPRGRPTAPSGSRPCPRAVTDDADGVDEQEHLHGGAERYVRPVPRRVGSGPSAGVADDARAMNVVVCVKQIPDPAEPGALEPGQHPQARAASSSSTSPTRYGVEMALQLVDKAGGGEVTLVSMAPNGETSRPAHRARHGCRQGHPRERRRPHGRRRPRHRQGAGRRHRAGRRRRPGARRHRVVRRLHGHRARADRRPPRPPVDHLRQVGRHRRRHRQGRSARPRPATTRSSRPLPAVVSVTAGVVEPRYPSFKGIMAAKSKPVDERHRRRPRHRRRHRRLGRRRPGDRRRRRRPRARGRRDHRGRRRGLHRRSSSFLDGLKVI